jgi:hypothetical protein
MKFLMALKVFLFGYNIFKFFYKQCNIKKLIYSYMQCFFKTFLLIFFSCVKRTKTPTFLSP